MKKLTSLQNKTFFKFWIGFHAVIAAAFALSIFIKGGINIDADLFNMFPKPVMGKALSAADEKLTEITAQNVFILVSNKEFDKAKTTAEEVYSKLQGSSRFKSVTLYQDMNSFGEIMKFIDKYKFNLLDEETIEALNNGGQQEFAQNAKNI